LERIGPLVALTGSSVAKRLGLDPDLKVFDKKLGKIARAKPKKEKAK